MELAPIKFNRPQLQFISRFPQLRGARCIWGRGVGKSSIIFWIMQEINRNMPRSAWALQGRSYQQILTLTLPGTLAFAEQSGMVESRDYFLGRYPPKDYALPFHRPRKPDNCLFLVNHKLKTSVVFTFFSQDTKSSSRGPSRDGIIVDEALLLDNTKFMQEAKATNRGNDHLFKHLPYHHGIFYFSSMPESSSWLLSSAEHYLKENPRLIKTLERRIDLQLDFLQEKSQKHQMQLWAEITELSKEIKFYPDENGILHSEYNVFDNIENLGLRYVWDMFKDTPREIFDVEVLNRRRLTIGNAFYPQLNAARHVYYGHFDYGFIDKFGYDFQKLTNLDSRQDIDCNPNLPICVGMDFGNNINWAIAGQHDKARNQFNFLKDFYVKPPRTFLDCIEDFCKYYEHHKNKSIHLYPDGEGNIKRANLPDQPTYVDQIRPILKKYKWDLFLEKTQKFNTDNHSTFLLYDMMLSERDSRFPKIRFNAINCKRLLFSMENTPSKNNNGIIKKDKDSERKLIDNREQATDAGDAADQIIFTRFKYLLKDRVPMGTPGSL